MDRIKVGTFKADTIYALALGDGRFLKLTIPKGTIFQVKGEEAIIHAISIDVCEFRNGVYYNFSSIKLNRPLIMTRESVRIGERSYRLHFANPEAPKKVPPLCFLTQ
ncbi:MAG: hypothetical protein QXE50_05710 [Nitrososphaerota archaeon]